MDLKPLSVTEITRVIKYTLESREELVDVWVVGEIYNLTYHSSGHIYFSLKDEYAVINAAFFKHQNKILSFRLENGMKVIALGSINVYEKRGSYQLIIAQVQPEGVGELQKKIDQLKKKLLAEGIFDPKRKRKLPLLPKRLGIVSSSTGAAIWDIIKVARKRYPNIDIIISPAQVQGADAAESIARAIKILNRPEFFVDVIIAGRGGGSFEDLMPFNEEIVVRAFYESRVPIISAVGHQIDHPLCDDAADGFAPTPSAAAEMCVPLKSTLLDEIEFCISRLNSSIESKLRELSSRLVYLQNRRFFSHPMDIVYSRILTVSEVEKKLASSMKLFLAQCRAKLSSVPSCTAAINTFLKDKRHSFLLLLQIIEKLSPISILKRGYSIITNSKNDIIQSIQDTSIGETVTLEVSDGCMESIITSISEVPRGNKKEKKQNTHKF